MNLPSESSMMTHKVVGFANSYGAKMKNSFWSGSNEAPTSLISQGNEYLVYCILCTYTGHQEEVRTHDEDELKV